MKRLLVLLTALLLLSSLGQAGASRSAPADAAAGREPLLATSGSGPSSRLFFADPVTLHPSRGRSLRLGFNWGDFSRSPDGSLLVLGRNDAPELRFVRVERLRFAGAMRFTKASFVRPVAWPSEHLLLTLVDPAPHRVLAIDPSVRKVLWKRSIRGAVLDVERSPEGFVVLAAPQRGIGPATIVEIGVDGSLRSVVLERIFAGFERDRRSSDFVGRMRLPGLAVDPGGNRAYVVGADQPIARVDLTSMSVTYHGGSRRLAKIVSGLQRQAIWLGNGMLAVTGSESSVRTDARGRVRQTVTPAGLLLVDTRRWNVRVLHAHATEATAVRGSLLAYGSTYDAVTDTRRGSGVTVYGLAGERRIHLFGRTPIDAVDTHGGLAYVWLPDRAGHVAVVDPKARRILAKVTRPSVALLTRR